MGRAFAIALNTLREAIRDKVLYAVTTFAAVVLLGTRVLAELSLDQQERVVRDIGIAAISLFGVLVALFLGSSLLYKEIERKTLYVVLPKPIHRWEFLVGKFAGIVLTGQIFLALIGGIFLLLVGHQAGGDTSVLLLGLLVGIIALVVLVRKASDPTFVVAPWAFALLAASSFYAMDAGEPIGAHLRALVLIGAEVSVLTAVALFFSSFSTPFLTGTLSAGVWLVGRSADSLQTVRSRMLPDELKSLMRGVAEVVPNFNLFVPGTNVIGEAAEAPWSYVGTSLIYALCYTTVLLILASLIFRRRDLA